MESPTRARLGWLLTLLLVIASLGIAHWRLGGVPDLSVSIGPELDVRTTRSEFDSVDETRGVRLQRGDRLISLGGQRVEDLRDVRIVAAATGQAPTPMPEEGEGVDDAPDETTGKRKTTPITLQIVRPLHRFTIALGDLDVEVGELPASVEPNDTLVEVDGRRLPGRVGIEGARSIAASRPDAVLSFERREAVFGGELQAYYSPTRFGYAVGFGLILLILIAIWRFRDPELDEWSPVLVGLESVCFGWVALLALRYMWVLADPVLYSGVIVSLVMMRPLAFLARARSSDEGVSPGAWGAFGLALVAAVILLVVQNRGLVESTEQTLHLSAVVALLYIVYEIIAGISKSGGATFGERSGYLAGFLALTCLGGLFAYFTDPEIFVEEIWIWFAVIMAALVWFGDVLFALRGRSGAVFGDIVDAVGRREVLAAYLDRVSETLPETELELIVWEPSRSVAFRSGIAELHGDQTSAELHDAISILIQEHTTIPLPDGVDRHTDPMAGIAQTMEMTIAMAYTPPNGAILIPDVEVVLVGFDASPAGEIAHYASIDTLEMAQEMMSSQVWVAAMAEALPLLTREQPSTVKREEAEAARAEAQRLNDELAEATSTLEFLRRDRSELAAHAQTLTGAIRDFLFPDLDLAESLLEPELIEGIDYLLEDDAPILVSGAIGTGKRFVAAVAHHRDERYPGELALWDACPDSPAATEGRMPSQDVWSAVMGGALVIRSAQWLNDSQLRALIDTAAQDHRLVLLFEDSDAEARSALDGRGDDLAASLMHRELVLPSLAKRPAVFDALFDHFLERANIRFRKNVVGFSDAAVERLREYDFPGNIAELEFVIDRAVSSSSDEIIDVEDLAGI